MTTTTMTIPWCLPPQLPWQTSLLLFLNPRLLMKQDPSLLLVQLTCLSIGRNLPPSLCMTYMALLRLFLSPPDLLPSKRDVLCFQELSDSRGMILNFLNPQ